MLACKQPYNVNVAAEAMARAALEHRDKILVTVRSLSAELEKTIAFVKTFRFLKPHPSSPLPPPPPHLHYRLLTLCPAAC